MWCALISCEFIILGSTFSRALLEIHFGPDPWYYFAIYRIADDLRKFADLICIYFTTISLLERRAARASRTTLHCRMKIVFRFSKYERTRSLACVRTPTVL